MENWNGKDLHPIIEEEDKSKDSISESDSSTIKNWKNHWRRQLYSQNNADEDEEFQDYDEDIDEEYSSQTSTESLKKCDDSFRSSYFSSIKSAKSKKKITPDSVAKEINAIKRCNGSKTLNKQYKKNYNSARLINNSRLINLNTCGANIGNGGAGGNNCASGSLDRRRKRLRNRNERDQRAKSQSDLCYERDRVTPVHYCSLQQFHCQYSSNPCINCFNNNTEERLRKLENDRAGLNMEVAVLSEQVDAQSNKIMELEHLLQEKKNCLRQLDDALQQEILSKSALETQKLELLTSLSEMKLKQASLEHENMTLRNSASLANGEKFSRHTGQYSSLPRPPTVPKKGVAFGKKLSGTSTPQSQSQSSLPTVIYNPGLLSQSQMQLQSQSISPPVNVRGIISSRCLSAPHLAEEDKIIANESVNSPQKQSQRQHEQFYNKQEEIESVSVISKSLKDLSMEEVEYWLAQLGLECYSGELRRWGATGPKLLDSTPHQIEKELDIKNSLHRKKLMYAIECERCDGVGFLGSEKMDNSAVLRWLDDIGLPQHKESFQTAKVDGRVLHRLTTEDLLNLGVNAQLHAASLRRGIQVLRELNFEFDNLERRSFTGDGADGSNIALWTNHRVMEWLRVVDLAEYAPNLRGSGVHGGLIVHEGRFTTELLAAILSIPPSKTLLRRHLTTHFNDILGRDVVQHKREIENTLGFVPLTLTARLKVAKKSQFTLKRKKSKSEVDYANLVCPLEASPPGTPTSTHSSATASPNLNSPSI
ncbi:kazrin-A isoform X1 [Cotesia glomerata]|uniref:kazrin-A isoform X1 n=1 Tax=Cotesia glomerata TaxID=32391 RepID=UPI001D02FDF7|nr:kazrin-A isoform X1 [Cotesia glomerata]